MFFDMIRQMDMGYSYKPVLIKAVLACTDDKGRVKLSDIVAYFRDFYGQRRTAGLVVEKAESTYVKGGYTDKDVERNILASPFKLFEEVQMMRHTKTLRIIQIDENVLKNLLHEKKAEIERICDQKLTEYYERW